MLSRSSIRLLIPPSLRPNASTWNSPFLQVYVQDDNEWWDMRCLLNGREVLVESNMLRDTVDYQMFTDLGNQQLQNVVNKVRKWADRPVDQYRLACAAMRKMHKDNRFQEALDASVRFSVLEALHDYSNGDEDSFNEMYMAFLAFS